MTAAQKLRAGTRVRVSGRIIEVRDTHIEVSAESDPGTLEAWVPATEAALQAVMSALKNR